ncbi:MAG: plastocyanin/azurin family copper-binding protein [Solirubrobacterales bacterium]
MSDATIFYVLGGTLAAMAVLTSLIGLRVESFPGRYGPLVLLCFFAVAGTAITFAILNGKNEEKARASETEKAGKAIEKEQESPLPAKPGEGGAEKPAGGAKAKGPGGTLQLAASPTALAFDKTGMTSKPGKVTIDFSNPAPIEHDVAIEQNGKQIVVSQKVSEGKTSVSAALAPGTYTFLCTVPGHAQAGMEGTLTVK